MIENINDFKWKCYTLQGEVEIDNNRNDKAIKNNSSYNIKQLGIKEESYLVDIIGELYFVMAYEKIDTDKNGDENRLFCRLKKVDREHNFLLRLKQMYYTEVQEGIERINGYCKNEEYMQTVDLHILIDFSRSLGGYHDFYDVYSNLLYYNSLYKKNPVLFKRLFNAMIDIDIFARHHGPYSYKADNIIRWFKLFMVLRDKAFGISGEVAWIYFLLNIFQQVYSETDELEWLYIDSGRDWSKQLNSAISKVTCEIERMLSSKIINKQKEMLNCYKHKPMEPDIFDSKIRVLQGAIQFLAKQKEYKDQLNRYLRNKERSGCVAVMRYDSRCYAAISGSERQNGYFEALKQILESESGYKVVQLNPNVRYYHSKGQYITYGQYDAWKKNTGFDESKLEIVNRMFSCCERKLLTKLYDKKNTKYKIYVKKKTCSMCQTALVDWDKEGNQGLIKYPKNHNNKSSQKKRKTLYNKLDEVAECVKEDKRPNASIYS